MTERQEAYNARREGIGSRPYGREPDLGRGIFADVPLKDKDKDKEK